MAQMVGVGFILAAVLGIIAWAYLTFFKKSKAGQTTVGRYITAALETAQLTTNLGYVELLSHVDAIQSSPEATAACQVISDSLWAAAKKAWSDTQLPTLAVAATTAKVTTVDGTVVEVPVQ